MVQDPPHPELLLVGRCGRLHYRILHDRRTHQPWLPQLFSGRCERIALQDNDVAIETALMRTIS